MKMPSAKKTRQLAVTLAASALPLLASGANISLTGNDTLGQTSFNTGQNWAGGAAPVATNDYYTAGFDIRTPGTATTNYTFAGNSLSLGAVNLSGGVNGSLLEKFTGGAGTIRWLTINNLTNQANAMLRSGGTAAAFVHIQGNHFTIAGNSIIQADQTIYVIDSPLLGGDGVILTNNANNSSDHVAFTGTNSGFTGSLYLTAQGTTAFSLELDSVYSVPGNPGTFNPGQITFLGSGQLHDVIGCVFTNSNGGFTLAANGNINTTAITLIGEPITDVTNQTSFPNNHAVTALTSSGTGTLILSNANNNYYGGTTISAGVLQLGVDNALPAPATAGLGGVTVNAILDLNTHNATINGLNGSGTVDTVAGGTPTLTVGANGDNGTFTGTIQNSQGTLSFVKTGAGTETLSGYIYSGFTLAAGGTLNLTTAGSLPSTPGNLVVSNGAAIVVNATGGTPLPAAGVIANSGGTLTVTAGNGGNCINATGGLTMQNSTLNLNIVSGAYGLNAAGTLTFQDNATNNFNFGTVTGNPTAPAMITTGGISAPGTNIVINVAATGLQPGTFTLIKYTGTPLASIASFQLSPPPGVAATLVNNTANDSLDMQITAIPNQLAWNGVNGTSWDLATANWSNIVSGSITVFQQYTNGSVVAGDAVTFDDTVTNDLVNPQPTNIVLNSRFYAFPVLANSTLPYSIAGAGGINGVTSLVKSNTGSLTLLTSNSYSGGTVVASGLLIITNDSALGASSGTVTLSGGQLEYQGNATNSRAYPMPATSAIGVSANNTVRLNGVISGAGTLNKMDNGTLILAAPQTFAGDLFLHAGLTIVDSGGALTNGSYWDVGQDTNDAATLTLRGTAALSTTSDFNLGDLGASAGVLNVSNSASLTMNAFFVGSANAGGSTASGIVNQYGGNVTEVSTAVGTFCIGGRTSVSGLGVYNMIGGTLTANGGVRVGSTGIGTLNQSGGLINAKAGINIARIAGSFGTNNLNGGTLSTFNIATSTGTNAVFNFNGGTLQANFAPPNATWFSGGIQASVLGGGAFVDSSNFSVTIAVPLLAGSASGGLTKLGTGTLTLSGTNTYTGPTTNNAGTLVLNSSSTYAGSMVVNAGSVQMTTASTLQGGAVIGNNGVLTINQAGSTTSTMGNLTLNGAGTVPGATLALSPSVANNPAAALVNCGTLTLNGTNTINIPLESVGTIAVVKYTALAGSGNCTNLALPQGAVGYISNSAPNSTIYAVITSTGPGIFWTGGTNAAAGKTNQWDVSTSTNWVLNTTPTTYHQVVVPGDAVTFSDSGNGIVNVNTTVGPTSLSISNNSKAYVFGGTGSITGPTGLQKSGPGTATVTLTNNSFTGLTVISNGTLQAGIANFLSPSSGVVLGPTGTLELAGFNQSAASLTGSGIVDNNAGIDVILTIGTGSGGNWNGSIQDHGHGFALTENGSGTWVVGGANTLGNGSPASSTNIFNAATTILTNGGSFFSPRIRTTVAFGGGSATMIVAGGSLTESNDVLSVGYSTNATGALIVNSGSVIHAGPGTGAFGQPSELIIGASGGTGTLTVNGGQVITSQSLWLGQNATGSGTLQLNGGLVQANQVTGNATPAASVANFNGGTLRAGTNNTDFIDAGTTANIQTGGLTLDDGGFTITVPASLQQDVTLPGGGLVKQGAGTVYLDAGGNTYTGTTLVTNGTLAGTGTIAGPVVVAPLGTLGAGDDAGVGTLTINNNLTLHGNALLRINKNGGFASQDEVLVSGNISYAGSLTVTNTTSDSTALVNGDTFQLFSVTGTFAGNFSGVSGSPGAGLAYSFNPTNGILSVVTQTVASNPTNITFVVSGSTLSLSWPADHQGWVLQAQTNTLGSGLSGNWVDIAGSASVTSVNITLDPTKPTVFYRLRRPF